MLFAVGATARWARDGIYANALHPGGIDTNLQRHTGRGLIETYLKAGNKLKTPEQGAATSVLLASSPELEGVGGRYYEDCNEAPVVERRPESGGGVAPYALDTDNADRLWELSERLLGAHVR